MAVAEGTYVIVTALDTTRALACYGSGDNDTANVCIWTTTDSKWHDSQFISIVNNSDGSQRMMFTLSGKSVDIKDGNIASGSNVQQYSNNSSRAQAWTITKDGKTAAVNGTAYDTYVVANSSNQNLVLDVTAASASDNANVQVYTKNGTDAQRWAFVPVNPVPIGTYMIRSTLDTKAVMDIAGRSTANGANAQLYGINDTNAQIFIVEHQNGLARIENAESGKCLSVDKDAAQNNQNVLQWDNMAYQWYIEPCGFMTINGCTVPTYIIHYLNGTGYCIDAAGGSSKPSTNIQIYTENKSKAQIWAFQPNSKLNDKLPVPSDIKGAARADGNAAEVIAFNNCTSLYMSWVCDGTAYQCRYRVLMRESSKGEGSGSWSQWYSIGDGSSANDGWGYLNQANCITDNDTRKHAPNAIVLPHSLDLITYDRALVEVQIRRFNASESDTRKLYEHGNSADKTIALVWKPTLTVTALNWTPDGLSISYGLDFRRSGNTIAVQSITVDGKVLCSGYSESNKPAAGTITIPVSSLKFTPDNGSKAEIKISAYTSDSNTSLTYCGAVVYNINNELSIAPSYTYDEATASLKVSFAKLEENSVYMITDGKMVSCGEVNGKYIVYPPSGRTFTVAIYCKDSSGKWGTTTKTMTGPKIDGYFWNWDDNCAIVRFNLDSPVGYSDSLSPDITETKTTGREYPVYGVSTSRTRTIKVSGIYTSIQSEYGNREHMEALGKSGHCIFRNPRGDWLNVVIRSVSAERADKLFTKLGEYGKVDVDMSVESP